MKTRRDENGKEKKKNSRPEECNGQGGEKGCYGDLAHK